MMKSNLSSTGTLSIESKSAMAAGSVRDKESCPGGAGRRFGAFLEPPDDSARHTTHLSIGILKIWGWSRTHALQRTLSERGTTFRR
jgi:hypothetical protein